MSAIQSLVIYLGHSIFLTPSIVVPDFAGIYKETFSTHIYSLLGVAGIKIKYQLLSTQP